MASLSAAESAPDPVAVDTVAAYLSGRHFLHVFPTFNAGGVPIRITNILNRLGPSLRHTIVSLDGGFKAKSRLDGGLNFQLLPVENTGSNPLGSVLAMRALLRRCAPDLLLTYNWGSMDWSLANLLAPVCPQIHFESGFGPEEADGQLRRRVWTRRVALHRVYRLVVPSHTLADLATRVWRLDSRRVLLIPNGVDCARFARPPKAGVVPGFSKAEDELIVGTAAPLRAEKNLSRLLAAFAALRSDAKLRLVIAGDGPERAKLQQEAQALGIGARVVFAGHVERVEDLLGWFDVFAMSSDTEQMPNSLIQAMAAGLPVAATDVGDVKVIVAPENGEFIVPKQAQDALTGALGRLIESAQLRQDLGAANRERARTVYSQDRMLKAYADVYAAALAAA
jgi:glycosyltransferase involved in cell wall biosynthesis